MGEINKTVIGISKAIKRLDYAINEGLVDGEIAPAVLNMMTQENRQLNATISDDLINDRVKVEC